MLKELLMSSIKGEVKKKHFCIGRNVSYLMTSECWSSHIADSSFSCYYPVALSDTLGHDANEDRVLVSRLIVIWDLQFPHDDNPVSQDLAKDWPDSQFPRGPFLKQRAVLNTHHGIRPSANREAMRQFRQLDQRGGRTSSLRVPKLLMFGVWLVVGTLANPAANPPTKKQADYRDWIASYLKGPLQMYDASKDRVVDVVVTYTAVGYVDLKSRSDAVIEVGCGVAADGTTVGANGQVGFFHEDCGGGRSGGYAAISDENLKKLRGLLSKLPDDHSQLPPAGRRLVVQVRSGTRVLARVYDRTDLPDKVLEILRLSNSGILSWAPKFDPRGQWKIGQDSETYGAIAFPVDGKQIITARLDGINVWDAETHALVKSFPYSPMCVSSTIFPGLPYHLVFSPDGLTAIIGDYGDLDVRDSRSWEGIKSLRDIHLPYLLHPQFSPDGSCLFVESGQSELLVFDTKTWERRGPLPETPTDAIAYFPSSNGQRAVYISKSGAIK
jgi:hypothetical protein